MKIIFVVLFALLIIAFAFLLIWQLFWKMIPSSAKKIFIAVTILGTLLFEALFIASAFIPNKIDKLLAQGIVSIENNINEISSDYTNEVLSPEKVKLLIADTKQIKYSLKENPEAGFIVKTIGLNTYLSYLEDFSDGVDGHLREFEAQGIPFTLHNIFDYLKKQTIEPVLSATKVIEIIILSLAAVFFVVLIVCFVCHKNGWLSSSEKITFGEGV